MAHMAVLHNFSRIFVTSWLNLLHFFQALKTLPFASSSSLIRNVKVSIPKCFICQKWKECHKTEAKNIPHAKSLILARKVIYCLHINWGGLWCPVKLWPRNTITFHAVDNAIRRTEKRTNANAAAAASPREKKKELCAIEFFTLDYCIEDHQKCTGDDPLHLFFFFKIQVVEVRKSERRNDGVESCYFIGLQRQSRRTQAALLSKSISVGVTCVLLGNHPRL